MAGDLRTARVEVLLDHFGGSLGTAWVAEGVEVALRHHRIRVRPKTSPGHPTRLIGRPALGGDSHTEQKPLLPGPDGHNVVRHLGPVGQHHLAGPLGTPVAGGSPGPHLLDAGDEDRLHPREGLGARGDSDVGPALEIRQRAHPGPGPLGSTGHIGYPGLPPSGHFFGPGHPDGEPCPQAASGVDTDGLPRGDAGPGDATGQVAAGGQPRPGYIARRGRLQPVLDCLRTGAAADVDATSHPQQHVVGIDRPGRQPAHYVGRAGDPELGPQQRLGTRTDPGRQPLRCLLGQVRTQCAPASDFSWCVDAEVEPLLGAGHCLASRNPLTGGPRITASASPRARRGRSSEAVELPGQDLRRCIPANCSGLAR